MTNHEIAAVFEQIADLLEFQDANPFRVRAYRNAARTIHDLTDSAAHIVADPLAVFKGMEKGYVVAGRIFLTPFEPDAHHALSGLGLGLGASTGNVDGEALPSFKSFGQNSFFPFASGVTEAGHRTRLAPQAYYYLGPFGVLAEYGLTEEGLQKGAVRRNIAFRAWQVQASFLLTGEKKGFTSPTPKKNFDPHNHGWGAVELAVRVGDFSAEPGIYNYGFASAATTPRHAHEWVGGVNWYLNRLFRTTLDYGHTNFGGGATVAAGGNRPSERVLILRFQINFI